MRKENKKAVVAMSGGVDSSVSALLLQKSGFDVTGIYMRLMGGQEKSESAARKVCEKLKINFYPINLSSKFRKEVVDYFITGYEKGITPNPCIVCNKVIKFKELLRISEELGADYLATGHYIKSRKHKAESKKYIYKLFKGNDKEKDQTYFLYNLTQDQLSRIKFPLGDYLKTDVKKIADKQKLPYTKKESQDVCFLNRDGRIIEHNEFLKKHIKTAAGPIKTLDGQVLGEHQGLALYTIGQRRGVDIGGRGPFWVVNKEYKTNTLYVTSNQEDKSLYKKEFTVKNINWISGKEPVYPYRSEVVVRYKHKGVACRIEKHKANNYKIILNTPERALTIGQSAVFYDITGSNELLGGGVIDKIY